MCHRLEELEVHRIPSGESQDISGLRSDLLMRMSSQLGGVL